MAQSGQRDPFTFQSLLALLTACMWQLELSLTILACQQQLTILFVMSRIYAHPICTAGC